MSKLPSPVKKALPLLAAEEVVGVVEASVAGDPDEEAVVVEVAVDEVMGMPLPLRVMPPLMPPPLLLLTMQMDLMRRTGSHAVGLAVVADNVAPPNERERELHPRTLFSLPIFLSPRPTMN